MIKDIFYTDRKTYIKDEEDTVVTTDNLGFSDAFSLAWKLDVEFDYENIEKEDEEEFAYFLSTKIGNCNNRNIIQFFKECEKNGINKITNNNPDLFGKKAIRDVINDIIKEYNEEKAIYNIECYGTDMYINRIVHGHLLMSAITNKINSQTYETNPQLYTLLKLTDVDNYNLDIFLEILKQFTSQN